MLLFLVLATIVAFTGYELWTVATGRPTISEQVWAALKRWPPLGFLAGLAMGLLAGHLFTC